MRKNGVALDTAIVCQVLISDYISEYSTVYREFFPLKYDFHFNS